MNLSRQLSTLLFAVFLTAISYLSYAHGGKQHPKKDTVAHEMESAIPTPGHPVENTASHSVTEFPNLHPLVVHFPIVLIIVAALMQVFAIFLISRPYHLATAIILALGSFSGYLAASVFHAHTGELPPEITALFEDHEKWAFYAVRLSALAAVIKIVSMFLTHRKWLESAVAILALAAAVSVAISGHHGAELVHKHNIGPKGNYLESHH